LPNPVHLALAIAKRWSAGSGVGLQIGISERLFILCLSGLTILSRTHEMCLANANAKSKRLRHGLPQLDRRRLLP
jgi:hypothetical protein